MDFQAKAILSFTEAITSKTLSSTVTLTAGRGRGKSAALGLSIAASLAHGYSNIFVTSPSPENLKTLFEFVFKGLDKLGYEEHQDYDILQSTKPEWKGCVVRVNIHKGHRQTIQVRRVLLVNEQPSRSRTNSRSSGSACSTSNPRMLTFSDRPN